MLLKLMVLWGFCLMTYCTMLAIDNKINSKLIVILAVFISINIIYAEKPEEPSRLETVFESVYNLNQAIRSLDETLQNLTFWRR